jgi:hypothetical protein
MTKRFGPGVAAALSLWIAAGCGDDETSLEHDFIKIQLTRADNQAESPFPGTAQIFVAVEYDECLRRFYESNPQYQQSGAEGSLVFGTADDGGEGWRDRLCDGAISDEIECEVASIEQELDVSFQLRVQYRVLNDNLETRTLKVGPIPKTELAKCDGGVAPRVRLIGGNPVRGLTATGGPLWETSSFDNPEAAPGQGAALVVKVRRPG